MRMYFSGNTGGGPVGDARTPEKLLPGSSIMLTFYEIYLTKRRDVIYRVKRLSRSKRK